MRLFKLTAKRAAKLALAQPLPKLYMAQALRLIEEAALQGATSCTLHPRKPEHEAPAIMGPVMAELIALGYQVGVGHQHDLHISWGG